MRSLLFCTHSFFNFVHNVQYPKLSELLTRVLTNTDQNNDALLSTERRSSTHREAANALSQTAPWNQSLEAEESSNADERVEAAANCQQLKQACQNGCPLPHHPCFKILIIMYMYVHFLQLISEIQRLGYSNEQNETVVQFGTLFDETVDTFDALSGILKTAKKHSVKIKYTVYSVYQKIHYIV